jgi:predicted phage terminase large subunit-like protein
MPSSTLCLTETEAARERKLRERVRQSLIEWSEHVLAPLGQGPAAHHRLMLQALQDVSDGMCDRLMVLMPPGAAKSTYGSVIFPTWWLQAHPGGSIIATAHTGDLARHFGRRVRDLADQQKNRLGFEISRREHGAARFTTSQSGSYYAVGVRGPVTGRRADLLLIDDPVRSAAEAERARARAHLWDWYRADLATRLRPGGAIVLVMTRWHCDDLAGRLLDAGDNWRVLRLPALAEADDPLGRNVGAALWPEWENVEALQRKRQILGERTWAALFQQRPSVGVGGLFRTDRIQVVESPGDLAEVVRAWDLASSLPDAGNPDWTVGLKLGRTTDGTFVVLDVVRLQGGPAAVEQAIRETAASDGPKVRISLPQDPGQAGRAQVLYLSRQLAGYAITSSPETGAKHVRAMPVAAQMEAGNLAVVRAKWNAALLEELADFPRGDKDDQVDALSRAFGMIAITPQPARLTQIGLLGR